MPTRFGEGGTEQPGDHRGAHGELPCGPWFLADRRGLRGALWDAYRKHDGQDGPVLVWQGDTRAMNPRVDATPIADAYEHDPIAAAAEYGAQFRSDIEAFVTREAAEAVVVPGRYELPPLEDLSYSAFVDPSSETQDSMTLAIAHQENGRYVLDLVRERKPPFSPAAVVEEFAEVMRSYRMGTVIGDRYGGEWPRESFRAQGIDYIVSDKAKSDIVRCGHAQIRGIDVRSGGPAYSFFGARRSGRSYVPLVPPSHLSHSRTFLASAEASGNLEGLFPLVPWYEDRRRSQPCTHDLWPRKFDRGSTKW